LGDADYGSPDASIGMIREPLRARTEMSMTQGHARFPYLLLGCLLAASAACTDSKENNMGLDPATAAYQKYGYNDRPVEAHLGPHRYLIPANYFRDQIGPDFQGNFSLLVQWPDLQPLPPGERSHQDMDTFARQITISPYYVDRVPIETRLDASLKPIAPADSPDYQDPINLLELRDRQPEIYGLTPYWVDPEGFSAYLDKMEQENGYRSHAKLEEQPDWYIARNAAGEVATVIKCGSHLQKDGFIIQGEQVVRDGHRSTECSHEIVIVEDKILLSIDYARVFLKDWKKIEQRARDLFSQYRTR
jgi:hypothetical protein